jgi:hypothetical protein
VYDISNNQLTGAAFIGTVGLDWQFAGIAPIHASGASDLVLRNVNTGQFEVYDIAGNTRLSGLPAWVRSAWIGSLAASPSTLQQGRAHSAISRTINSCRQWLVSPGMQPTIPIASFLETTFHSSR